MECMGGHSGMDTIRTVADTTVAVCRVLIT